MEFISNLIKRPMSLVLNDSSSSQSASANAEVHDASADTETRDMSVSSMANNSNAGTAVEAGPKPNLFSPTEAVAAELFNGNLNFLLLDGGGDCVEAVRKQLPDTPAKSVLIEGGDRQTPVLSRRDTAASPQQTPQTPNSRIEELLIEINDNLNQVGFTDDNIITTSHDAMVSTVKLSPLPTKAFGAKLTPVATRTNPSTPYASPVASTSAANATTSMEFHSPNKQLPTDTVSASPALSNGDLNKTATVSKFVGLQEFDESTIPELPGSLNANLEDQLKVCFEDGLIPMLTANINAEQQEKPSVTNTEGESRQLRESLLAQESNNAAAAAVVDLVDEYSTTDDNGQRQSCAGDITFENEAMDIDMSFNEEAVGLVDATHAHAEQLNVPSNNVTINMNFVEHAPEQKHEPSVLAAANETINIEPAINAPNENADVNCSSDKPRLTFAVTASPEPAMQQPTAATAEQLLNGTMELPEKRVDAACELPKSDDSVSPSKREFADVVLQVAAEQLQALKAPTTPLAADAKPDLTLDMSASFCSAKGSLPASPTFPIKPSNIAGQFPSSPKTERANDNTFVEHSELAQKSLKFNFETVQLTTTATENCVAQDADDANDKRSLLSFNNTFNGTASAAEHADSANRRRTFNVTVPTMPVENSLTTFPVNNSAPAAPATNFNQSDVDRRRTYNLSDKAAAEQQTTEQQLEDELHNDNSIEPMDVDVSMSMSSTPALANGISSTPQLKSTAIAEEQPLASDEAQPTAAFRSNSPPLPTHQNRAKANAMEHLENGAAGDAVVVEAAAAEQEVSKAENLTSEANAGSNFITPHAETEQTLPCAFVSTSPPLPTHQANRQSNMAAYESDTFITPANERAASPPLPAQQAKQNAHNTIEYGAAGDGPVPVMHVTGSPPLPTHQRKSLANANPAEYSVSPLSTAQQQQLGKALTSANVLTTSPAVPQSEMNTSYSITRSTQPLLPSMQQYEPVDCSPTLPTAQAAKPIRQSILTTIQDFQQQPMAAAALSGTSAIKKRPPIHNASSAELLCGAVPAADAGDVLSAKEKSKKHLKDEKDIFDDMFAKPFGGCSSASANNHFDFQQLKQQQEFEDDFRNQSNLILNPSDFDYLLTKGNNNVQVDRSSLLLRFDPLLGVPVPVNQAQQQQQQLQQILAANCNTNAATTNLIGNNNNINNKLLSPTAEEEAEEDSAAVNASYIVPNNNNPIGITSAKASDITNKKREPAKQTKTEELPKATPEQKHASMSVDIIKDMNIENDCNKAYENSNIQQSDDKQINYKMDELEKKIQNEVMKTEDIEKKLKEAEQREEALIKRITEKDKTISKMNGVIEAYEKAIAELIAEKEQLIQNYEKQLQEVKADRDSNYHHLTSLETTFSDLHVKYEKSKEMTSQLKSSEESLLAEKRQNLENLRLQEQRYEKMKNHAMQQLEIANKKLEALTKEHAIETTKLKALLKKEEISRASINEQLQQKSRENAELVKICDELINGQGS